MGTACNLTYLGPFGQMRAAKRLWNVGVAQELPRTIAERIISTYYLAEWKLEDVPEEEVVEQEPEPEPVKLKRRTKKIKTRAEPEPEADEPGLDDLISETFDEGPAADELKEDE